MKLNTLFITCGGTGGHFYPGLTIAKEFKSRGGNVLLLLSGIHAVRQAEIASEAGIAAEILPWMPQPRKSPFKFIYGVIGGSCKSLSLFLKHKPDALLGMGSFASVPAVIGAKLTFTPLFLHDGNARIGRANRFFSRFAKLLATGYPAVNADKTKCRTIETGMPVRHTLLEKVGLSKSEAVAELNGKFSSALDSNLPTVLVFGGSQGSTVFNENFPEAFCNITGKDFQVLHLTGKGRAEETTLLYKDANFPHLVLESSEDMHLFLAAADVAVCRSGGSSLAELALFGLPAVLIPYPFAAEKHQTDNARVFSERNAAILADMPDLDTAKAQEIIESILQSPEQLKTMSDNMRKLAKPDATAAMLELISDCLNK